MARTYSISTAVFNPNAFGHGQTYYLSGNQAEDGGDGFSVRRLTMTWRPQDFYWRIANPWVHVSAVCRPEPNPVDPPSYYSTAGHGGTPLNSQSAAQPSNTQAWGFLEESEGDPLCIWTPTVENPMFVMDFGPSDLHAEPGDIIAWNFRPIYWIGRTPEEDVEWPSDFTASWIIDEPGA